MLKMFFNLDDAAAEQTMGPVGASFFVEATSPPTPAAGEVVRAGVARASAVDPGAVAKP
jgi:hypothetical protein